MRSARVLVILVCALSTIDCKKHPAAIPGSGDAGSDDGGTDNAEVDAGTATPEAVANDVPPASAGAAHEAPPTQDTGNASSFVGAYDCWGGVLTLAQTGRQITGNAYTHIGTVTQTTEVLCTLEGNRCVGQTTYFSQKGDHPAKTAGKGKLTLTSETGGLRYTTTHGGAQQGFCPKR
jgi:hypothetical protein